MMSESERSNRREKQAPVLDGCFHLHTLLSKGTRAALYGATHKNGREVLVKLTSDPEGFFDELAALYRTEQSHLVPACLTNYPPASVLGQRLPLEMSSEEIPGGAGNRDRVGALVMDWVEGTPLDVTVGEPLQVIDDLLELTTALGELAAAGVAVGDLRPEYVRVDHERDSLQIVTLGTVDRDRPGLSPELQRGAPPTSADDIYMLGAHFLAPMGRFGRIAGLARRCMRRDPARRPDLAEIQRVLKRRRRDLVPKRNLEILVGMMRPMNLLAWAVIVTLGVTLLPTIRGDRPDLMDARIEVIREKGPLQKRVADLRSILRETEAEVRRTMLIEDIAALQKSLPVGDMPERDRTKPLAVFTFRDAPVVIGHERVYRLGDWVRLDGRVGYLSQIRYNGIRLQTDEAAFDTYFHKPSFFEMTLPAPESAILYDHENSLSRVLSVVAEEMGLVFEDQRPPEGRHEGKLVGEIEVATLSELLEEVRTSVALARNDSTLRLLDQGYRIPVYRRYLVYQFEGTVEELGDILLKNHIGCDFFVSSELASLEVTVDCYNVTWEEILSCAGLNWSVVKASDGKHVVLESVAPREGD